jgi:formylglycine-generating enzyme required for sulfatase activity
MARALGVVIKTCETIAFAHSKGVVHRDLKPANIVVGRYGETYVVDWGLARISAAVPGDETDVASTMDLAGRAPRTGVPGASLMTAAGDVMGTPAYMAPEQASGDVAAVGPRSDVYSIGAVLYHLLSGYAPYSSPHHTPAAHATLRRVLAGPPPPLRSGRPGLPEDLVAICDRAMAREPLQRYAGPLDVARDVEAFLSDRPIEVTSLPRALALVLKRHRGMVATAIAGLLLAAALVVWGVRTSALESAKARVLDDALVASELLRQERDGELWPAAPEREPRMREWMSATAALQQRWAEHERLDFDAGFVEQRRADLRQSLGLLATATVAVARRLAESAELTARLTGADADAWALACRQIRASPRYGFELAPQLGLVPLGENPGTGLFEFWCPASGTRPLPDPGKAGGWLMTRESGLLFVLLPGGSCTIGDAAGLPWEPEGVEPYRVQPYEQQQMVEIGALFVSKYEVTQGQFERVMGFNPSKYAPVAGSPDNAWTHPVERISWFDAGEYARRIGAVLPEEAQWEYACRGGTTGRSWVGAWSGFEGAENFADRSTAWTDQIAPWADGHSRHAPVGAFRANPFGLFDVAGNVAEWCVDRFTEGTGNAQPLDAAAAAESAGQGERVVRGGNWSFHPRMGYSALRAWDSPRGLNQVRGVRPVRGVR